MMQILARLFGRGEALSEATARDTAAIAALHMVRRGWSEVEIEQMLLERNVVAHRATLGRSLHGFILSRLAAGEAENPVCRGGAGTAQEHGLARSLLNLHLRRLAGLAVKAVFLEVDGATNRRGRLYHRAGFREDERRRAGYYQKTPGQTATALVLRRDLV